ncbi:cytosine permease [Salinibacterium sp. SYSU T00001]|uniref:purine-cytosine permease family protein n=1 Tax=Homoserinimonas sedimenticola TaxID=2986805 RepID=UPI0022364F0A|nr:cytosine permease [Salinibacterium sedimenticola]MCW4385638.1 cytosine permease [Salinibacterium sedimenticola]
MTQHHVPPPAATDVAIPTTAGIEVKSIDWVPLNERHGKPGSLFSLWFMSNANLTTLATGMVGVAMGGNFLMSVLAIVMGVIVGTIFTAFHSAQGPQLGLPQMIQSRAQFGYRGVAIVCLVVVASIVGFNIFNQMLGAEVLTATTGVDAGAWWYVLITVVALTIAVVGYDWIHRVQSWLTWLFLATFGVFTVVAFFALPLPAGAFSLDGFNWAAFLVQFAAAAAYALGWAPYVSDYSRYLPPQTSPSKALFYTSSGVIVGAGWLMLLGAFVASLFVDADPVGAIAAAADQILPGLGLPLLWAALPALVTVITINIYAASIELITVVDSFRPVKPTLRARVIACSVIAGLAFIGAAFSTGAFLDSFSSFLTVLLYVLVPWTSVNLVDYYFVRRGRYAVAEMFRPNGVYGAWGGRGIAAYVIGIVAMIPFVVTTWFVGPAAAAMGDIDIALFVGLIVSAVAYLVLARNLDLRGERELAEQEAAGTGVRSVSFGG